MGDPQDRLYPETAVGGYSRVDGVVDFYGRVNALLRPEMTVLDFGAGRGEYLDTLPAYSRSLRTLKGKVAKVIGVDVDPVVSENPSLDEALVMQGDTIPLPDASVDLVVTDHVFEHLDDPAATVSELDRVLRPGGWIAARTPNRRGYIGLATRAVPNRLHTRVLSRAQPDREARDVFPTRYRLNTPREVRRHFPADRFEVYAYSHSTEPAYFGRSYPLWWLVAHVNQVLPQSLGATYLFFVRKRLDAG